ncbi:hypothetical protein HDU91_001632 [Kappamyces sp. JEL0680]|nr:hypothetical protein HDU91_001632 [Kappamyces sp. JEL0680]
MASEAAEQAQDLVPDSMLDQRLSDLSTDCHGLLEEARELLEDVYGLQDAALLEERQRLEQSLLQQAMALVDEELEREFVLMDQVLAVSDWARAEREHSGLVCASLAELATACDEMLLACVAALEIYDAHPQSSRSNVFLNARGAGVERKLVDLFYAVDAAQDTEDGQAQLVHRDPLLQRVQEFKNSVEDGRLEITRLNNTGSALFKKL